MSSKPTRSFCGKHRWEIPSPGWACPMCVSEQPTTTGRILFGVAVAFVALWALGTLVAGLLS